MTSVPEMHKVYGVIVTSYGFDGRYFTDVYPKLLSTDTWHLVSLRDNPAPKWLLNKTTVNYISLDYSQRLQSFLTLYKLIRNSSPSVLISHLTRSGLYLAVIGKILNIRTVYFRHHTSEHIETRNFFGSILDLLTIFLTNQIVVFSRNSLHWLKAKYPFASNKMLFIYQGFDFTRLETSTAQSFKKADKKNEVKMLVISRYVPQKGYKFLFEAIYELRRSGIDCIVDCFGDGDFDWISKEIAQLELEDSVFIKGFASDIREIFPRYDFLVHPSLADSFSQVLIEAQACGLPAVATNIAGASEQIQDGVSGILVEAGSSKELYEGILRMISLKQEWPMMSDSARKFVRSEYPLEKCIEDTKKILFASDNP